MSRSDRLEMLCVVGDNWRLLSSSAHGVHHGERPSVGVVLLEPLLPVALLLAAGRRTLRVAHHAVEGTLTQLAEQKLPQETLFLPIVDGQFAFDRLIADQALDILKRKYLSNTGGAARQVGLAAEDGYKRLLSVAMETDIRLEMKKRADEEAIGVFAENLRQRLLASPDLKDTAVLVNEFGEVGLDHHLIDAAHQHRPRRGAQQRQNRQCRFHIW